MSKEDDLLAHLPFVREFQRLKNSDRFEDNFHAEPAQTALRHIKARVDDLIRSDLAEPVKESVRKALGELEELVKKAEDEDVECFATPSARYLDLNLMVARVMVASFCIGLLYPSNIDLIGRARLRGARKKKAANNAPGRAILESVVGDGGKRSARSWMGPVNRARAAAGLREYKSEDPIQRYLQKQKTPRS